MDTEGLVAAWIVVRDTTGVRRVALFQRIDTDMYNGTWGPLTGHIRKGETPIRGVLRETIEELALDSQGIERLHPLIPYGESLTHPQTHTAFTPYVVELTLSADEFLAHFEGRTEMAGLGRMQLMSLTELRTELERENREFMGGAESILPLCTMLENVYDQGEHESISVK